MASAVPHAVLRKLCQGVLCCPNFVYFHGTRMNVIMWTTIENVTLLAPLYANLQMVNNIMIKSLTSKISQVGEQTWKKKARNSFTPLNKLWFSRNSQALKVCAHLLTGSVTNRKKTCRKYRKKLKNEFRCTEFDPNRKKSIEITGKISFVHVTKFGLHPPDPYEFHNFCILSHQTFPMWNYTELSKEIWKLQVNMFCALRKSATVTTQMFRKLTLF